MAHDEEQEQTQEQEAQGGSGNLARDLAVGYGSAVLGCALLNKVGK